MIEDSLKKAISESSYLVALCGSGILRENGQLVLGTSLRSEPARQYSWYFDGNHLIIVNSEPDYSDRKADLAIHASITDTLKKIAGWAGIR